jgi:hypothetical protein
MCNDLLKEVRTLENVTSITFLISMLVFASGVYILAELGKAAETASVFA